MSVEKSVALVRMSMHGPPCATQDAADFMAKVVKRYPSQYGERYCTRFWYKGASSNIVNKVRSRKWDW